MANGKLAASDIFKNIFIQPAAGDAGGALGAALAAHHIYFENDRVHTLNGHDHMTGAYLGPEYSSLDIEKVIKKYGAVFTKYDQFSDLSSHVSQLLSNGKIVGWMQGRMEFGPRALGGRSILGDPRDAEMQKKLNLKIKYRESFRPFAPSVLFEESGKYFEMNHDSPYMLMVRPVQKDFLKELPENYHDLSIRDKLYTDRSHLPAITHVDFFSSYPNRA